MFISIITSSITLRMEVTLEIVGTKFVMNMVIVHVSC